jgi:hypothetical protein
LTAIRAKPPPVDPTLTSDSFTFRVFRRLDRKITNLIVNILICL